jgi:hypothetical protein
VPGPPGEDPFATDGVVYCDEVVEALRDYRSEISPYPVVEFVGMATEGSDLVLDIAYPGGCGEHRFGLCQRPFSSAPSDVRIFDLYVAHDSDDDVCGAIQHATLRFDVSRLADELRARAESFGFSSEGPVALFVDGFDDAVPLAFDGG